MKTILSDNDIYRLKIFYYRPESLIKINFFVSSFTVIRFVEKILNNWPNTSIASTLQRHATHSLKTACLADIVLIGGELEGVTDLEIAEMLRDCGYSGIIASVAQGANPRNSFKYHFGRVNEVATSKKTATDFIEWIKVLINEVEMNYFPIATPLQ